MSDNDLYLQYVDEIVEQLNQQKAKTRDDIQKYFDYLKNDYMDRLERALDEIFEDYCDENNLDWSDEDEQKDI